MIKRVIAILSLLLILTNSSLFAAYNLEVPPDPWEEYKMQYKNYSKHLLNAYDKGFLNNFEAALAEADKAIEILPDEGLAFAERAYFNRMLNNHIAADRDYKSALSLFAKSVEKYSSNKKQKKGKRKEIDRAAAEKLAATTMYQRGELYFRFENYKAAIDDYAKACQLGEKLACAKMWETKAIEKRGANWAPLVSKQFYDKTRIDVSEPGSVKVWLLREETSFSSSEDTLEEGLKQHIEIRCKTSDYNVMDGFDIDTTKTQLRNAIGPNYQKASAGSGISRLIYLFCRNSQQK